MGDCLRIVPQVHPDAYGDLLRKTQVQGGLRSVRRGLRAVQGGVGSVRGGLGSMQGAIMWSGHWRPCRNLACGTDEEVSSWAG